MGADNPSLDDYEAEQLARAVDAETYSPWTLRMLRLYLVLAVAYLCGCLNGYDGSLMGGLNGMTSYLTYFDMWVFLLWALPPCLLEAR